MDDKTREALEQSIEHWKKNVVHALQENWEEINYGVRDCALCGLYYDRDSEDCCKGCPVMERTGKFCCFDTPYWKAVNIVEEEEVNIENLINACIDELLFLTSLLYPKEELVAKNAEVLEWVRLEWDGRLAFPSEDEEDYIELDDPPAQ